VTAVDTAVDPKTTEHKIPFGSTIAATIRAVIGLPPIIWAFIVLAFGVEVALGAGHQTFRAFVGDWLRDLIGGQAPGGPALSYWQDVLSVRLPLYVRIVLPALIITKLILALILAPLFIAIHRQIAFGTWRAAPPEHTETPADASGGSQYLRYFFLVAGFLLLQVFFEFGSYIWTLKGIGQLVFSAPEIFKYVLVSSAFPGMLVPFIILLVPAFLAVSYSMALPATALDTQDMRLPAARTRLNGNVWRTFALVLVIWIAPISIFQIGSLIFQISSVISLDIGIEFGRGMIAFGRANYFLPLAIGALFRIVGLVLLTQIYLQLTDSTRPGPSPEIFD
jgi:hypothetical protein